MYMSGVAIGIVLPIILHHHKPIPQDQQEAPVACIAGVAGTTVRTTAEFRIVATTIQAIATTAWASALCVNHSC